jgi:nucleoside-diphosphate-sugar epimerase
MMTNVQSSLPAADLDQILARTAGLWDDLRGRTVFMTGGTGFFGRWLLESFVEANCRFGLQARVVVLSRNPQIFRAKANSLCTNPAIHLVQGDVRTFDAASLRAQLGSSMPNNFHAVIHAASETSVAANRDNPQTVIETLVDGTRRVLDFVAQSGVENFLLVSSGAVYGRQPSDLSHVPENFPGAPDLCSPLSAYGEGKRVAELLCHAHARTTSLNCRIARCFAFVGPHLALDAHYAIGNFIRDALMGNPIQVKGDGTPFRSYLYAADLAAWLWTILLHPAAAGTYNVGSDEAYSIYQIAEAVARHLLVHPRIRVAQRPKSSCSTERYVPDISRARRTLGLEVWTPLELAVRQTLEFYQNKQTSS